MPIELCAPTVTATEPSYRPSSCTTREYEAVPSPMPPCASGTTRPKSPASLSSRMNAGGSSPATSHARKSFSREPSIAFSVAKTAVRVSFSCTVGSG